ncbi:MAG: M24 family metallopeptidase [Thaumarchaeota archaeon]|nr:M24 family metallopeptidase [Nitrososphaerota archaeon]
MEREILKKRHSKVVKLVEQTGIDALIVRKKSNLYYLTGLRPIGTAILLIRRTGELKVYGSKLDFFEPEEAIEEISIETGNDSKGPFQILLDDIKDAKYLEADEDAGMLVSSMIKNKYSLLKIGNNFIEKLRRIKDETEIKMISKSCVTARRIIDEIIENVKPGISERDLAKTIEKRIIEESDEKAFETLVASGNRSAIPHGKPTEKRINENELVVIDMGVEIQGYKSDITRTILVGGKDEQKRKILETVIEAHDAAVRKVQAGVKISEVSKEADVVIEKARMKEFILHSLGHGVGLDIHEEPTVNLSNEEILEAGNVITIEPGIYIRGLGGARWEDTILVENKGYKILTEY